MSKGSTSHLSASNRAPHQPQASHQQTLGRPAMWSWRFFVNCLALLTALMVSWSLASPLMSIPDEPAHAIRAAATVRGDLIGTYSPERGYTQFSVPNYIAYTRNLPCYSGNLFASAACSPSLKSELDKPVLSATSASTNSPVYYAVVGLPTLVLSDDAALYAMRFVSLFLCALLLSFMLGSLRMLDASRWTVVAAIVGITPTALFLSGSINPNGVEMAAAGSMFAALIVMFRNQLTKRQVWSLASLTVASAILLTGTRSISLLWLFLVAISALAVAKKDVLTTLIKKPAIWYGVGGTAIAAVGALIWFTTKFAPGPPTRSLVGGPMSFSAVFSETLKSTFDYWTGWIGYFGWLDQPSPQVVYIIWYVFVGVLLLGAIGVGRGAARIVTIFLAIVSIAIPPIVQATLYPETGWLWQGRYLLALNLCIFIAAGMAIDAVAPQRDVLSVRAIRTGAVIMAFGQLYPFMVTLQRYVVGDGGWLDMVKNPLWQPPLGWVFVSLFYASALVVGVVMVWRYSGRAVERFGTAVETAPDTALATERASK